MENCQLCRKESDIEQIKCNKCQEWRCLTCIDDNFNQNNYICQKCSLLYFFASLSCNTSKDNGAHFNFSIISATFSTSKYPTKQEIINIIVSRNKKNHIKPISIISYTQLTREQYEAYNA